jgi:predicted O-methyltransferase YrrM
VEFAEVADAVSGVPFMSETYGRRIYDHLRETDPEQVLELGTAHGVGTAYIAAALEANGRGHVTSVDYSGAAFDPPPEATLEGAGLAHRASLFRGHSSYNWFLKERIEERSDEHGNCEPLYDFCYLDGPKNLNVDGLAVFLVEKLLRPGAWLLMDDLGWTYAANEWAVPAPGLLGELSEAERTEPHLRAVFELIVKQHPNFTSFRFENDWYGWAQKLPGAPRRYEVTTSTSLQAAITNRLRRRLRRR